MKKDYLENIAQNYDLLVPKDKETLLLLISLSKKIKSGEIEQEFSQHDFETQNMVLVQFNSCHKFNSLF